MSIDQENPEISARDLRDSRNKQSDHENPANEIIAGIRGDCVKRM